MRISKAALGVFVFLVGCAPVCRYEAIGAVPGYALLLDKVTGELVFSPAPPTPLQPTDRLSEHKPVI